MDEGVLELEQKIGLKKGFLERLAKEDDWSFIIKLHALFETVCSHLLLYHFKESKLGGIISRLELSNKSTGKLEFLKATELLGEDERKFIYKLSELRNTLVHDVRNTNFSLDDMIKSFNDKELTQFTKVFSPFEIHLIQAKKKYNEIDIPQDFDINSLKERAKISPKEYILNGAHNVLVEIVDMFSFSDYKQWLKAKEIYNEEV